MKMKNVLIMHTGGWIGDMILLTPALRGLKTNFPDCKTSMLVLPLVRELMERNPYLDEIIVYDKRNTQKGIRQMREMASHLRSKDFDTAIILHPNSVKSAILAYMAGIPERIGLKLTGNGFFLTTKVKQRKNIHEVKRYLDIIAPIAGTNLDDKLEFWGIEQSDKDFVNDILKSPLSPFSKGIVKFPPFERGIMGDLKACNFIVGLNVSTTWKTKQWRMEKFTRLVELLYNEMGAMSVLTGGKFDIELGEKIIKLAQGSDKYIVNLTGHTTLWQLGAIIKHCHLYITCDSGPMHISSALNTPTIALFGPTDPVRHRPYGEGHKVIKKDMKCSPCYERECKNRDFACMEAIQVEDVMESIRFMLSTH
jgi:ADP-heptose:LPS heptosyltransferase